MKVKHVLNAMLGGISVVGLAIVAYASLHPERFLYDIYNVIAFAALPGLVGVVGLIGLVVNVPMKQNFILALVTTGFSIYALELGLRFYNYIKPYENLGKTAAIAAGRPYDERTKYDVVMDLKKADDRAVPSSAPHNWMKTDVFKTKTGEPLLPINSIANRQTVMCNEDGRWIVFNSDRYGYRNDDRVWNAPIDIVQVGDSYTYGACVADDEMSLAKIKTAYPRSVSMGLVGHGPLLMLATLREYVQQHKPKVVLWNYYSGNDFPSDFWDELNHPLVSKYMQSDFTQNLASRESDAQALILDFIERSLQQKKEALNQPPKQEPFLTNWRELAFLDQIRKGLGLGRQRKMPQYEELRRVLAQAKALVSSWGGTLVFVYQGDWHEVLGKQGSFRDEIRGEVLSIVEALKIPLVDTLPAMRAVDDAENLFPFVSAHYGPRGYAIVGEAATDWLKANEGLWQQARSH